MVDVGFGGVNIIQVCSVLIAPCVDWLINLIIQPIRIPRAGEEPVIYAGTGPENYRITTETLSCGRSQTSRLRYILENQTGVPHAAGESLKGEGVQNGTGKPPVLLSPHAVIMYITPRLRSISHCIGHEWKVQYSFDLEEHFLHDMNALHWGTCVATNGPQAFRGMS